MHLNSSYVVLSLLIFAHFHETLHKVFPGQCPVPQEHNKNYYLKADQFFRDWFVVALVPELQDGTSLFKQTNCWILHRKEDTVGCKNLGMVHTLNFCSRILLRYCLNARDINSMHYSWYILDRNLTSSAQLTYFNCQDDTKWTNWYTVFFLERRYSFVPAPMEYIIIWGCKNIDGFSRNEGALIFTQSIIEYGLNELVESFLAKYLNFTELTLSDFIIKEDVIGKRNNCLADYKCKEMSLNYSCTGWFLSTSARKIYYTRFFEPKSSPPEAAGVSNLGITILICLIVFALLLIICYKVVINGCFIKRKNQINPQSN